MIGGNRSLRFQQIQQFGGFRLHQGHGCARLDVQAYQGLGIRQQLSADRIRGKTSQIGKDVAWNWVANVTGLRGYETGPVWVGAGPSGLSQRDRYYGCGEGSEYFQWIGLALAE